QKELYRSIFVEGCCYGKCGIVNKGVYYKYCGKEFWELISGIESFYIDVVEPIGRNAKEKNETYKKEYDKLINRLVKEFTNSFCKDDGSVSWEKLLKFNSSTEKSP
ncbi:MAG: cytosolic protein, partial [Aquificota bacterium]